MTTSDSRPRILFIVDHPNWAHDFKTQNLARILGHDYDIQRRYQAEVTADDLSQADLVLVYYWLQFEAMKPLAALFERYSEKLVVGICSNWELESTRREPGLAVLRKLARAVFVNNLFLYSEYQPIFDVPVYYTPNGVDTNFFHPPTHKESSSRLRVGWAGSLTSFGPGYKGYHELIVPAVNALDGVELITAAREETWRRPDEMREFYHSLDSYICASRTEGTPNPCLEAAACGVPLLTTRVGNMPELVVHGINGLFIEREIQDVIGKLRSLRESQTLRLSLGRQLSEDIQLWDWSLRAPAYGQMFAETLTRKTSASRLSTTTASGPTTRVVEPPAALLRSPHVNLPMVREALTQKARASLSLLPANFISEHQELELTIVMLSYGRLDKTLNAIRALHENVGIPFKLVLVDNNSEDIVRAKLAEICAEHDFIELLLLNENLGCAGGRDLAFKHVTTRYVLVIDNDLEVLPGAIEHLLHQFDLHPAAAAVTGKVVFPDGRIHLCGANFRVDQGVQFYELLGSGRRFDEDIGATGACDWVPGGLFLTRTDLLQRFPYDLKMRYYFEDNEWCYRINLAGAGKFYRVVEALGIHHHESMTQRPLLPVQEARRHTMKYLESLAYFYRKHGLIYGAMFHLVPELGTPTSKISISAARIFLDLINSYGGESVLERWNNDQLAPLFTTVVDGETQVAMTEAEKAAAPNGTLGWKLLKLYGMIKYPYLLPIYRLFDRLLVAPGNPASTTPAVSQKVNTVLHQETKSHK